MLTPREAGEKIIVWWRLDYHLTFIAFWICMLYAPFTVACVKKVVRRYVDENDNAMCNGPCSPDFDLREWMR